MKIILIIGFVILAMGAAFTMFAWNSNRFPECVIVNNESNSRIIVSNAFCSNDGTNCDKHGVKRDNSVKFHLCLTCNDQFGSNTKQNVQVS